MPDRPAPTISTSTCSGAIAGNLARLVQLARASLIRFARASLVELAHDLRHAGRACGGRDVLALRVTHPRREPPSLGLIHRGCDRQYRLPQLVLLGRSDQGVAPRVVALGGARRAARLTSVAQGPHQAECLRPALLSGGRARDPLDAAR